MSDKTPGQAAKRAFYEAAGTIDELWEAAAQAAAQGWADRAGELLCEAGELRVIVEEILDERPAVSAAEQEDDAIWRKRAGLEAAS